MPHLSAMDVPELATATDVIDMLTEHVSGMVMHTLCDTVDQGLPTRAEFDAAFARCFDAALPAFFARLDRVRPDLAATVRARFVAEYEAANA